MLNGMDQEIERLFAARYEAARKHLRAMMETLGLHESEGWRISEITQETEGGSRVVLRPIHTRLVAPPDVECIVWIHEEDGAVDADCVPGGKPA
jgi:hypothetical protein